MFGICDALISTPFIAGECSGFFADKFERDLFLVGVKSLLNFLE